MSKRRELPRIELSARNVPWSVAAEDAADAAGLLFVAPVDEDHHVPVTIDALDTPAWEVFEVLGAVVGKVPEVRGSSLFFADEQGTDLLSAGPFYQPADEVARAMTSLHGVELFAVGDQVFGEIGQDDRLGALFQGLRDYDPAQWEVGVWLLEVGKSELDRFSLEVQPEAGLSMVAGPGAAIVAEALLRATVDADSTRSRMRVFTHARLLVSSGKSARIDATETVPIPHRTVSPQGTVSVSGYTFVDAGLLIEIEAREVPGGAFVSVRPEISSIVGFVGEAPRIARRSLSTGGFVQDDGWLVIAGLEQHTATAGRSGPLRLSTRRSDESTSMLAIFEVRRVVTPRQGASYDDLYGDG